MSSDRNRTQKFQQFVPGVEGLEDRTVPSGNVQAFVFDRVLYVAGDDAANRIWLAGAGKNSVVIRPLDADTTINGQHAPLFVGGVKHGYHIAMGGGDDGLLLTGLQSNGGLNVDMGDGNDVLGISGVGYKGETVLAGGGGDDIIILHSSSFRRPVYVNTGAGDDQVIAAGVQTGDFVMINPLGTDYFDNWGSSLGRTTIFGFFPGMRPAPAPAIPLPASPPPAASPPPVAPTNNAPVAADGSLTTDEDTPTTGTLAANDVDGDALTYSIVDQSSAHGTVTITNTATGAYSYAPNSNYKGPASFTFKANDGTTDSNTATVSITVTAANDAGTFGGDTSGSGAEDGGPITGTLTFTDTADGATSPNFTVTTDGTNGTATIDNSGNWSYTPNADFNGPDSFTVSVTDDDGNVETQLISVTVTQVNDAGTFGGDTSGSGAEDGGPITGTLTFADAIDGFTSPNFTVTTDGTNGTATIDNSGNWSYTPNADFNGPDSFTVSVTDDDGNVETQLISVTVTQVNDAGTFGGDTSGSGAEDGGPITGTLTFADAIDGFTSPNFTVTTDGTNGTATIDAVTGAWSYTPNADFNGPDSFTVSVTDDDGNVETQLISVTVTQVNDAGTFGGDTSGSGAEDGGPITGTLTFTDTADGATSPNFTVTTDGTNGTATIDAVTGAWSYTPNADFNGPDSFTVSVTDDDGNVETQLISVTVTQVNDAGTFGGDTSGSGAEDGGPITGTLTFTDTADGATSPNFTVTTDGTNGTATIDAVTGAWSYTPNADFNGPDSFTVSVTDDDGNVETQLISVTVTQVNDAGTFGGDTSGSGAEDGGPITGTLTFADAIDGFTSPNFTVTTDGTNGTATIDNSGNWSYTPNADFNGPDSFTVSVTDDDGNVETQLISVTVTQVNDAGTFGGDTSGSGAEDGGPITGTLTFADAIDGFTSPNFTVTTDGTNGTATIDNSGNWSYTPNADFNGPDSFTVSVTDDDGNVETQLISITVTAAVGP